MENIRKCAAVYRVEAKRRREQGITAIGVAMIGWYGCAMLC